jgi:hypothetical protein
MAFKTGFVLGAAVGYVLGAKAGRERYDQIKGWVSGVTESDRFQTFTEKGRAYRDLTAERVKGSVGDALHTASEGVRDAVDRITDED